MLKKKSSRQYDPQQIAFNVTASVSIAQFEHEPDQFDDLFVSLNDFPQIYNLAKSKFQKEEMNKFLLFRSQRLLRVPLDQLRIPTQGSETEGTSGKTPGETSVGKVITQSAVNQPTVHTAKVGTDGKPEAQKGNTDGKSDRNTDQQSTAQTKEKCTSTDTNVHNKKGGSDSKTIEQGANTEKADTQSGGKETTEKIIDSADLNVSSQLLKQYDQFAQQLGLQDKDKEQVEQDVEIIPEHPTGQIVLKIEEIPPLDVFYSPKHKVVVRKQRKRRKIDQDMFSTPQEEFMNIVYKNTEVNPSEDLTKLSQYAGAYSAATIDKAAEVSQLMTQKDLHIAFLEEQANESQQKIAQLEQQLQDQELRSKEL